MAQTIVVTIRIDAELVGAIDALAELDSRSRSNLIVSALREWFAKKGIELGAEGVVEVETPKPSRFNGVEGKAAVPEMKHAAVLDSGAVYMGTVPADTQMGNVTVVAPAEKKSVAPRRSDGLCEHGADPKFCRMFDCVAKRGGK